MNKLFLCGNISTDITVGNTKNNKTQVRFNVAVTSGYGDNKTTEFIPCIAWGKTAETIATYFAKGRKILIEGSLSVKNVKDDKGGWKTYVSAIIDNFYFVDNGKKGDNAGQMSAFGPVQTDNDNIQF